MRELPKRRIVDNHIHLRSAAEDIDTIMTDYDALGVERVCMLSISNPHDPLQNENAQALWFKHLYQERIHIFPGCTYYFDSDVPQGQTLSLAEQVDRYVEIGIDGWKLLEGKPGYRKEALNGPFYEAFFAKLNENKLPVLWHVGDPIEFWNPKTLPKWAMPDWCYNESHPSLESLREEALAVIATYRDSSFILAHMFFLGYELERAQELLDTHPNAFFDLAPGVEMFFGFSEDPQVSHDFFCKNADRILFGTDRGVADMPAAPRAEMIRRFLETEDTFDPPHSDIVMWPDERAPIRGIGLPTDVLEKIYYENFTRLVGSEPTGFDSALALEEVKRLAQLGGADCAADTILKKWKALEARR